MRGSRLAFPQLEGHLGQVKVVTAASNLAPIGSKASSARFSCASASSRNPAAVSARPRARRAMPSDH